MGFDIDVWSPRGGDATTDPAVLNAFAEADRQARTIAGGVDGFLHMGCLDCGDCQRYLFDALGRDGRPGEIWPPEELLALSQTARWSDPESVPDDLRWAYWSARKFLDVCIGHDLGVWFC